MKIIITLDSEKIDKGLLVDFPDAFSQASRMWKIYCENNKLNPTIQEIVDSPVAGA